MPKLLFARPLEEHERDALENIMTGDNSVLKQRALIILLSSEERYRVPEIAPMVGLHLDKVRKWITRFNKDGLKGLQPARRKPGPRGKFPKDTRETIMKVATTPPRNLGLLRTSWTLDSLRDYLIESGLVSEISRESLRQILLQGNVDWQGYRSRSDQAARWLKYWKAPRQN